MPQFRRAIVFLVLAVILIGGLTALIFHSTKTYNYRTEIEYYANMYGVDTYLVLSVIKAESNFDETAESSVGAKGLMQIMPATAEWLCETLNLEYSAENLYEPKFNINLGTYYLSYLLDIFPKEYAIAAYNAGEGRMREWLDAGINIDTIPFDETREYVKRVLKNELYFKNLNYLY